tara:strand:+ start:2502 stop:3032 length:531 start_codon:yes stop_codon:yes gene_type:complete
MANAVSKVIPITLIYVIGIVFFINYILLEKVTIFKNIPNFFMYIIYSAIFYGIYGYFVSIYASYKQCRKYKKLMALRKAIKSIILPIIVYVAIYLIPQIRSPFNELFGDNVMGNSICEITLISLNLITSTIINYFDSVKEGCMMSHNDLEKKMENLDKYLNKKPIKKIKKSIEVRD